MAEITNQLLKDAIADAEAVRQTAIANAKIALEETFTPQIKSMLARRLRAESMEEDEGKMKDEAKHMEDESAKELAHQDATAVGGKGPEDTSMIGKGDNKEPSKDSWDSSHIDQGGEGHGDSKKDWYDDWSESDFDLDEVIKELEEDILGKKKEEEEEEELDEAKKEEEDDEEELDENWEEEGAHHEEDDEEDDEEDEGIVDPTAQAHTPAAAGMKHTMAMKKHGDDKPAAAAVAPMGAKGSEEDDEIVDPMKGQKVHGFAVPEEAKGHEEEGEGEEELDLEAILRELEADGHHKEEDDESKMAHKMESLQNELAEYRKAVSLLRGKLQEVNLLNAKLLFTNKLFRNDRLTNEQKIAIVENFDRATTVREVKIVYTTLVETLNSTAKAMTGRKTTKVVTEGLASKPTKSTAPKTEILEENSVAKRLQQLAGIL